jgi:SAM-dependent methyltransferase
VTTLFDQLEEINSRPKPFEFYTAGELWTDEYTSGKMLSCHLDGEIDVSSRKSSFIDRSARWIISEFGLRAGVSVADFGCGPGLYARQLARTGAAVTGIDFSRNSLDYARNRAREEHLAITYVHQNYLEFQTEDRFDLILMIYCDFCALSPGQRKVLLEKFALLLKPGGSVLLDAYTMIALRRKSESAAYAAGLQDGFWSPDKYYGFRSSFTYDDARVTLDKYTIVEKNRTRTIYNWLQYFDKESIAGEFAEGGLAVVKYLANVAGDAYDPDGDEFAVIAQRRTD